MNTSSRDRIANERLINGRKKRWDDVATPHRCAIEKQGEKKHEDMRRIRERTCDFAPTENFLIGPIDVGIATPVISKVTAIYLALFCCE